MEIPGLLAGQVLSESCSLFVTDYRVCSLAYEAVSRLCKSIRALNEIVGPRLMEHSPRAQKRLGVIFVFLVPRRTDVTLGLPYKRGMFNAIQTPCPITSHPAIERNMDPMWHNVPQLHPRDQPSLSVEHQKMIRKMWRQYAASHTP